MALHAGELARLQGAFQDTFGSTAVVMRRTSVADTSGGFVDTYVAAASYPCQFVRYPIRPLDRELQPRVQVVTAYLFVFPAGSDVRATDRLQVGTRTFEVVEAGPGSLEITRSAYCQEIQ